MTEIRVLDTYWSDHCRHTTFSTELTDVKFDEGDYQSSYRGYISTSILTDREVLYKGRRRQIRLSDGSCPYGHEKAEIRRKASGSGRK